MRKEIEDLKKKESNRFDIPINVPVGSVGQISDSINSSQQANLKRKGRRKGSLSPPGYESDEDLRKVAMTEHDFLFDLAEKRKVILIEKLKEYKENKITDEINKFKSLQNQTQENNSNNKSNSVENILGENFQEAINFLNKISRKNKKDKDKLRKLKKREREKNEINNINVKSGLNSNSNILNISTKKEASNNNNSLIYDEENIPDININAINSIDLMEEQIMDVDEIGVNERAFNECVEVNANYDWSSKYKPIKPRYSNKVKMGFDWNRHNQAHYTSDNLPPKTIQGYRFNIFYPYLVDKTKTPQYKIERSNTPDTCILRFHSGAPYEDIAFKIKNREWDMSEKSGFKNIFDKGILRLYFKFKRFKYKR